ncbi:MAG: hypothetical protein RLZZ577_73 [Bacteroidota bacterium]|jgi:hypothetical protein
MNEITVIVDSRERCNMNILKYLNENNIKWIVEKLDFGDYTCKVNLDGKEVDLRNILVIERKNSLTEISNNFCRCRNQFETEFCKGINAGAKWVLLVEDEKVREKCKLRIEMDKVGIDQETIFRKTWRSRMSGNAMTASFKAFKERYNLELVFCKQKDTAKRMLEIFDREVESIKLLNKGDD